MPITFYTEEEVTQIRRALATLPAAQELPSDTDLEELAEQIDQTASEGDDSYSDILRGLKTVRDLACRAAHPPAAPDAVAWTIERGDDELRLDTTGKPGGNCVLTTHTALSRALLALLAGRTKCVLRVTVACPDCNGVGWYTDTAPNRHTGEVEQVQVQCERCYLATTPRPDADGRYCIQPPPFPQAWLYEREGCEPKLCRDRQTPDAPGWKETPLYSKAQP